MWLSDAVPSIGTLFGILARGLSGAGGQVSCGQCARPHMGTACRAESSLELKQLTQLCEYLSRRFVEIRSRQAGEPGGSVQAVRSRSKPLTTETSEHPHFRSCWLDLFLNASD